MNLEEIMIFIGKMSPFIGIIIVLFYASRKLERKDK